MFTGREFENIRKALDDIPMIDAHGRSGAERSASSATFDLFHAGYPWLDGVLAMASERANLIVDRCCLPIISPSASRPLLPAQRLLDIDL